MKVNRTLLPTKWQFFMLLYLTTFYIAACGSDDTGISDVASEAAQTEFEDIRPDLDNIEFLEEEKDIANEDIQPEEDLEDDTQPEKDPDNIIDDNSDFQELPEYIFKVDYGDVGLGEPFWFVWEENSKVAKSTREAYPVFDQSILNMKLESCFKINRKGETSRIGDQCSSCSRSMRFTNRGEPTNSDIPDVFSDGILSYSNMALTLEPLPVGIYEMKLYFHDVRRSKKGVFEVFAKDSTALRSLGFFTMSTGEDASDPTTVLFRFNMLTPGPMKILIRHIHQGYVLNGFELSKFRGLPDDTYQSQLDD